MATKINVPSDDELKYIRNYILLPLMLTIVESNFKKIEMSSNSLKKLYLYATRVLMDRVHADLVKVRKTLRERSIKVFEDKNAAIDGVLCYRFSCRGYEQNFQIMREVAKAEISVRIANYIAAVCKEGKDA